MATKTKIITQEWEKISDGKSSVSIQVLTPGESVFLKDSGAKPEPDDTEAHILSGITLVNPPVSAWVRVANSKNDPVTVVITG